MSYRFMAGVFASIYRLKASSMLLASPVFFKSSRHKIPLPKCDTY